MTFRRWGMSMAGTLSRRRHPVRGRLRRDRAFQKSDLLFDPGGDLSPPPRDPANAAKRVHEGRTKVRIEPDLGQGIPGFPPDARERPPKPCRPEGVT